MTSGRCSFRAAGRVNLIGEHTDYTGGFALPMAIDRGTTLEIERGGDAVHLTSTDDPRPAIVALDVDDPASVDPPWARYVAGVVAELRPPVGITGVVSSDLPIGAGVSSSASLELAVALALGFSGGAVELAQLCQRAEQRASGVPCGILDQLSIASGVAGAAMLIDCSTLSVRHLPIPEHMQVVGIHSGQSRDLASSAYGRRRSECASAEAVLGPLRHAAVGDVERIPDPVARRRARHVVTENARVLDFAAALDAGDLHHAGRLLCDSHRSLRNDFEVTTPALDRLVDDLVTIPGVYGARMTGAGFGGMVIALCEAGPLPPALASRGAISLRASTGLSGAAGSSVTPGRLGAAVLPVLDPEVVGGGEPAIGDNRCP